MPSMQYFWKELASTASVSALPSTAFGSALLSAAVGSALVLPALADLLLTVLLRLRLFTPGGPIVHVSMSCTPLAISLEGWHRQQTFFLTSLAALNKGISCGGNISTASVETKGTPKGLASPHSLDPLSPLSFAYTLE